MRKTWSTFAHDVWQGAKWVWIALIIAIGVNVASDVFAGKQADVSNMAVVAVILWLRTFGFYQILTLSLIGLFIVVSLASGLTTFILGQNKESTYTPPPEVQEMLDYLKKDIEVTQQREEVQQALEKAAFTQYLRSIEDMCETISVRGLAQPSRAMVFLDVPLETSFVHLHVVADEPIYDAPGEQKRQLEAMRQRTDLSREERGAYLQGLRLIWQSQLRRDVDEQQAQQPLLLEELLLRLTSTNPVAVLLGAPGSGKATCLRWFAFHMARASLSLSTYPLPHGLGRPQIPLLIQTKEYADKLERDSLTLKQFLIVQWNSIHPNLARKMLDELSQGRCLVLFDVLDQATTLNVRRRVIAAIYEFIADYASDDPTNYNRFIVTSRIAESEPSAFTRYTHYTLLDLNEQQIEQLVANWYLAIAHSQAEASKGMQTLTSQEEAEVHSAGAKQQKQLLQMLKEHTDLMQLATNPLALTMMVLLHASGRDLLQHHIELCQMLTRTLLDTWNRESGRRMFSGEEMPLAEQLLGNLAFRLHESGVPLSRFDVMMTTRQTLATFQQRQPGEIREHDIMQFIETLRRSSGLFVEGGEDLYYFAKRPLQDYYVIMSLLQMPQEEWKQFALQQYHSTVWHEPLLLALRYKTRQNLLTVRARQQNESAPSRGSTTHSLAQTSLEEQTRNLQAFERVHQLTKQHVEELLAACIDTRPLPEATQQAVGVGTIQEMAWKLLRHPFVLQPEALDAVLRALESSKAPICEGAAMLLQHSTTLPQERQQQAADKILHLLIDNDVTHQYSPLSSFELRRLYDTLFETLQVLSPNS
jgi:hypothetical protein